MLADTQSDPLPESEVVHRTGGAVSAGTFVCVHCGVALATDHLGELPDCERCGPTEYRRASLFEQPTADAEVLAPGARPPTWLAPARSESAAGQVRVAFEEAGEPRVVALEAGWTRIGRSVAADLRLDDPTVSRRHAQIVRTEEDEVRVIDDRSLNGVFVNGERVDWAELDDGDELSIGRYRLHLIAP